jgi:hypothetical protein
MGAVHGEARFGKTQALRVLTFLTNLASLAQKRALGAYVPRQ